VRAGEGKGNHLPSGKENVLVWVVGVPEREKEKKSEKICEDADVWVSGGDLRRVGQAGVE